MPTYRFNITDGRKIFDPHGIELPDDEAARRYAKQLAHGFIALVRNTGVDTFVEVVTEDGITVARITVEQNG